MPRAEGVKVLAIGLDSFPGMLVERLMAGGEMPFLASLRDEGTLMGLESTHHISGPTVWPTFLTGLSPQLHGVYGEWQWDPVSMSITRYAGGLVSPFWRTLLERGVRVGMLDVPYAPVLGADEGFEVAEWGAHEVVEGKLQVSSDAIGRMAEDDPHPYGARPPEFYDFSDRTGLDRVARSSFEGIERRGEFLRKLIRATDPDFAIAVFPELHHAGHNLWHTLEPDDPMYGGSDLPEPAPEWSLLNMARQLDAEMKKLAELVADDGRIFVFSLHGMWPSMGVPSHTHPFLTTHGFTVPPTWRTMTSRERKTEVIRRIKRKVPERVKNLYHQRVDFETRLRVAASSILEGVDWSRTRAFTLPSDDHGHVRLNLRGRERFGIVEMMDYEALCKEIGALALDVRDDDGRPFVQRVIETADGDDPVALPLPDLVLNWTQDAIAEPHSISAFDFQRPNRGIRTGQHTGDAFCIAVGDVDNPVGKVPLSALHEVMLAGMT